MNVERGGMGVSMKSARVEVPRVTIPAPERGSKVFTPKESVAKENRVQGFNFATVKPFVPIGFPSPEPAGNSKDLTKEKKPSPIFDAQMDGRGIEVKTTNSFKSESPKLPNRISQEASFIQPERVDPQIKITIPAPIKGQKAFEANETVTKEGPVQLLNFDTFKPFVPAGMPVPEESENTKVNLIKKQQPKVSLTKAEKLVPQVQQAEQVSKESPEEKQLLSTDTTNDKTQAPIIIQKENEEALKQAVLEDNEVKTTEKIARPTEQRQELIVEEHAEEESPRTTAAFTKEIITSTPKTEQTVSLEKDQQEIKVTQRESDLQQAQTVIQAWERLAGPQELSLIKKKVMGIIDQKQEAPPEDASLQQSSNLVKVQRPFVPELEQEEFETIVRDMVKEGYGLQTIYEELTERKVLVNQQPPSLTIIFQIVLTEITVVQENKDTAPSRKSQKTFADFLEVPQNKKRAEVKPVREESQLTIEEENGEHDQICFIDDLEGIVTKELQHEMIKDESAIGNYITMKSDKGVALGTVNKKNDSTDTKLIESDGKIGLEEICPACLGLLKERHLKMTVTRTIDRLSVDKTRSKVIVFNYSKNDMGIAA